MKRKVRVCILLIIVTFLYSIPFSNDMVGRAFQSKEKIRVGYIDYAGFIEKKSNGEYYGYGVEYLNEIAKYTDWEYEYVYDTWENCLQLLKEGKIDLLCTAQYTPERGLVYDYSMNACGKEFGVIYIRADDDESNYTDMSIQKQRKVGMLKGSFQNYSFEQYAKKVGFTYQQVEYDTDARLKEALQNKEIDMMIAGSLAWQNNLKVIDKFSVDPFYFITKKGNTSLMNQIDDAMNNILCRDPFYESKLYDKYYGTSIIATQPIFTKKQTDYIKKVGSLKVGYIKDWYPYAYIDDQGNAMGAIIELCRRMEELSGLQFQYCSYDTLQSMYEEIQKGTIDIIADVPYLGQTNTDHVILTEPYVAGQLMIFSTGQYITQTENLKIVVRKSMRHYNDFFNQKLGVQYIYWADTLEDCVQALRDKKADFAIVDNYNVNKMLQLGGEDKLLISHNQKTKVEISFGVSLHRADELIEILNTCIPYISSKDSYEAINLTLSKQKDTFKIIDFLRHYYPVIILIIVVVLAVISAMIYLLQKHFSKKVRYDKLTGAYTQSYFEKIVPKVLEEAKSDQFYIITFEIVRFKYFSQYYGRKMADDLLEVLIHKVKILLNGKKIVARICENTFAILFEDKNYIKLIQEYYFLLDEIRLSFRLDVPIMVNFGIYHIVDKGELVAEMIDKAILAQRSITDRKRMIYAVYNEDIEKKLLAESQIEEEMRKALHNREFQVYYQPKIDLSTKKVVGAEALIRWIKKDGTRVFPDQFIPIFERNGFVEELDYFVLNEVCRFITTRIKEDKEVFPISVNQSRYLFSNPKYVENIQTIIDITGVPSELIELELTETLYMENETLLVRVVDMLRERNIKFAIDDFGSGYSSLNLITEMPADILKIDRTFLIDSEKSQGKKEVIKNVVDLAHKLNLTVVCEGVETKEQEEFLSSIHCDIAQGYYYAKPLSVEEFSNYVAKNI